MAGPRCRGSKAAPLRRLGPAKARVTAQGDSDQPRVSCAGFLVPEVVIASARFTACSGFVAAHPEGFAVISVTSELPDILLF